MRSHVVSTTKAAASPQLIKDDSSSSPPSESSSSFRDNDDVDDVVDAKGVMAMVIGPLGYGLRENPKKSFRLVDPEFSSTFPAVDVSSSPAAAGSSIVVQDRESETESSRAPTIHRRRSKRARKSAAVPDPPPPEPEPVSSVSDTTPEEDVAISLMILSRDIWTTPVTKSEDHQSQYNHQRLVEDYDDDEGEEEEREESRVRNNHHHPVVVKGRSKYQCGTCKKVFRSYQALGGHRASHKKANGCVPPTAAKASTHTTQIHELESAEGNVEGSRRGVQHECAVCHRVFSSGQALGGHKRSHLTSSSAATIAPPPPPPAVAAAAAASAAKHGETLIDLNLPAPMEDDAELSAVSDAGFVMARTS